MLSFCADWEKYRGCKIEYTCAVEYGVQVIKKLDTEVRSIALTNHEWSNVETYLMFTEEYFRKMVETWEELAQKKDLDGNLEHPIAAKNVEFLREAKQDAGELLRKIKGWE